MDDRKKNAIGTPWMGPAVGRNLTKNRGKSISFARCFTPFASALFVSEEYLVEVVIIPDQSTTVFSQPIGAARL
jgi:hypothetical protein